LSDLHTGFREKKALRSFAASSCTFQMASKKYLEVAENFISAKFLSLTSHHSLFSISWSENQHQKRNILQSQIPKKIVIITHIHYFPLPAPTLSSNNPFHDPIPLPEDPFWSNPYSKRGFSKWSLSLTIPHQRNVYNYPLPHTCYMTRRVFSFYLVNPTIYVEEYISLNPSLCSFLISPVTSSLLVPHISLNTPFSNTPSLRSSLDVSD